MATEQGFLWFVNSAPVVEGAVVEQLEDGPEARALVGGPVSPTNVRLLRELRTDMQEVMRGRRPATKLARYLDGMVLRPSLKADGVTWVLDGPRASLPFARIVLEWFRIEQELPGRLRACANPDCTKFFLDHSRPNSGRWCSMAQCGNRLKARRHQARVASGLGVG